MPGGMIEFSPYRLDLHAGRLWRGSHPVALRPKAWALLCYLAERPGALITKEELHAAIWGDAVVSDDTLTRTLGDLRRALLHLRENVGRRRRFEREILDVLCVDHQRRTLLGAGLGRRGGAGPVATVASRFCRARLFRLAHTQKSTLPL